MTSDVSCFGVGFVVITIISFSILYHNGFFFQYQHARRNFANLDTLISLGLKESTFFFIAVLHPIRIKIKMNIFFIF